MRLLLLLALSLLPLSAHAQNFCGGMGMPAAELKYISRGFGHGHTGLDMMAPEGSPIRAAAGGTVVYAGWYFAYGNIVDVQHADGVVTRYAHMSAFARGIAAGTPVAAGTVIGNVGHTGRAHGSHVHFEVRLNGHPVDPRPFLALAPCPSGPHATPIEEARAPEPRRPQQQHR
jgi:murein DD-endopeptidase MepM/ murein hydrolase activator NlpD